MLKHLKNVEPHHAFMHLWIVGGLLVLIALIAGFVAAKQVPSSPVACTQEAKVCPDGSTVGRTGPACEFSACPPVDTASGEGTVTASMGEEVTHGTLRLTPLSLLEDSRCPLDVACIQAGTVRVEVEIVSGMGTSTMPVTLNESVTTEAEQITLVAVEPAITEVGNAIPSSSYRFTFSIQNRSETD